MSARNVAAEVVNGRRYLDSEVACYHRQDLEESVADNGLDTHVCEERPYSLVWRLSNGAFIFRSNILTIYFMVVVSTKPVFKLQQPLLLPVFLRILPTGKHPLAKPFLLILLQQTQNPPGYRDTQTKLAELVVQLGRFNLR